MENLEANTKLNINLGYQQKILGDLSVIKISESKKREKPLFAIQSADEEKINVDLGEKP